MICTGQATVIACLATTEPLKRCYKLSIVAISPKALRTLALDTLFYV